MHAVCMLMLHTTDPCSLRGDFPSATHESTADMVQEMPVFYKPLGVHTVTVKPTTSGCGCVKLEVGK